MTKQAERDYALAVRAEGLYRRPFNAPAVLREFAIVLDILEKKLPRGAAVLDLGCGPGWSTLFLAQAGYEAVGVDIAERMIEIARDRSERENTPAAFHVADIEELDLEKRDFDGVVLFDSLHHCPGYKEVLHTQVEHLRPGGWLLVAEPSWLHTLSPHARAASKKYGVTELGFSRGHLQRQLLRRIGFQKVVQYHDAGHVYAGFFGFLLANLRLWGSYLWCFPHVRQFVLAEK